MAHKKTQADTAAPADRSLPPVAYSYLRFSSHGQADGDSVRRQTANPQEWCERNGVRLDSSLVFEDRARSAFKKHNRHREALTEFRQYVAEGRIRPGSFLIVENLDRLSREQERIAVELLLSIVNAGITVVQLMPEEQIFSPKNLDMLGLMRAVIQMAQAHQESAKKANRLGEVWEQKRQTAAKGEGVLTSKVPGWIDLKDGKMKLNAERAAIVRRIYKLCIQGYGGQATAKLFNSEKVPTLTGRGKWHQSAVTYILRSRSVLGEHQPFTTHGTESRLPVGEPIRGYYPAVIDQKTFDAAQAALAVRVTPGRPPKKRTNIFRGLLWDARGGGKIGVTTRTWEGKHTPVLVNCDCTAGEKVTSFPADIFERYVLALLREVDPRELLGESAAAEQVLALQGERDQLAKKIELTADALGGEDSPTVTARIRRWESELRSLDDRLTLARQEAANPLANAWGEVPGLVEIANTEDGRIRISAVLRRVAERVDCLFVPRGRTRLAAVQMRFAGGGRCRSWLIVSTPAATAGSGARRKMLPPRSGAKSFTAVGLSDQLDLRKSADVVNVEKMLIRVDLAILADEERDQATSVKPATTKGAKK